MCSSDLHPGVLGPESRLEVAGDEIDLVLKRETLEVAPGLAAGEVELGLSIIADILPVEGVEVLGPLPPELQRTIAETAGVGAGARDRAAAEALLAFLRGPLAAAVFRSKGFDPAQ